MVESSVPVEVGIPAGAVTLPGDLRRPPGPQWPSGLIVFAHGSGSSRRSGRNVLVADALGQRGYATLLFDLLAGDEERRDRQGGALRFDIGLLAERLVAALDWAAPLSAAPGVGLFGASTGAAAALVAAAQRPAVRAVVSRGGRPDLAGDALSRVQAPTLLLVGGRDDVVLDLNRRAAGRLAAGHELIVVPGATHLFEEPGALEEVARHAGDWFDAHLRSEA